MDKSWQETIMIFSAILSLVKAPESRDWRFVEALAERHSYIVALLDSAKGVVCTGTIMSEHAVLTSGKCVNNKPRYIAVGLAVVGNSSNVNHLFKISSSTVHEDYAFEMKPGNTNLTHMHSNIGIVYTLRKFLMESFFERANIGNYYASELRDKQFSVIGYGKLRESDVVVPQEQWYHQAPCLNPKWYYCVCGYEYATMSDGYIGKFGEGAPMLIGSDVVAVTAVPCGSLSVPISNIKYCIFTVIEPYKTWITKKTQSNEPTKNKDLKSFRAATRSSGAKKLKGTCLIITGFLLLKFV